jgi:Tol biopolymer transport system component
VLVTDALSDAIDAACSWNELGAPELISGLGITGEPWGPALSADGTTLYFALNDGADERIMRATRADRTSTFTAATDVENVQSSAYDGTPFESADGRSLYFYSARPGGVGSRDLWVAQRSALGGAFGTPSLVPIVNGPGVDQGPRLAPDDLWLSFTSTRTGGAGGSDVWVASRNDASDDFEPPMVVMELSSSSLDSGATFSEDGLLAIVASTRAGGMGGFDLWSAVRADASAPFEVPENLAIANSTGNDVDPILSADGTELFFSSNRDGVRRLWRVVRECVAASAS